MADPSNQENNSFGSVQLDRFVGYHLRRVSSAFGTNFNQAMAGTGLRQVLFGILSIIDAHPGINQGAVGRALGIKRANMVSLINELVDGELLDRKVADDDRRAFSFQLTPKGRMILDDAFKRVEAHEETLLANLSPSERQTLIALLKRIENEAPGF